MGSAPFSRVAAHAPKWQQIGASPALLRMIKYGVLLPWTGQPRLGVRREYPPSPEDYRFSANEMDRWVDERFAEEITEVEARRVGLVVSAFVVHGAKRRVVIDYTAQNEVLGARNSGWTLWPTWRHNCGRATRLSKRMCRMRIIIFGCDDATETSCFFESRVGSSDR
jgi:hypothetical protein